MSKRILFIAPACIPIDGPESICNFKVVKLLVDLGWSVDLISKRNNTSDYPVSENTIEGLNSLKIIQTSSRITPITIYQHIAAFILTGFFFKRIHWALPAIRYAEKLLKNNKYDYIITRNYPSEIVGLYLSKKYDVKLIINWNDPFPDIKYPYPYGKGADAKLSYFENKLLNNIQKHAYKYSFPSIRLRDYFLRFLKDVSKEYTFITPHIVWPENGLDTKLDKVKSKSGSRKLSFVHSGSCVYPRDPINLLLAISRLSDEIKSFVVFDFIGGQSDDFIDNIKKLSLEDIVNVLPSKPYFENLKICSAYDIAIILEADLEEGIFMPTKISDYLQSGLRVFSISPCIGLMNDYYNQGVIDFFGDVSSVDSIYNELIKIISFDFDNDKREREYSYSMSQEAVGNTYQNQLNL